MARRKKLFRSPFKFKVKNKTMVNIIGFILVCVGFIALIAQFGIGGESEITGEYITRIRSELLQRFGFLAIAVPFLIFLLATHFFATKKVKIFKAHVTVGTFLVFASILGVFRSGSLGDLVYSNLASDFSGAGAVFILTITFVIGLVLFLDTSIDAFVIFLAKLMKALVIFIKDYVFRELLNPDKAKLKAKTKEEKQAKADVFIRDDKKAAVSLPVIPVKPNLKTADKGKIDSGAHRGDFTVRPFQQASSAWVYPPISLLADLSQQAADRGDMKENAHKIEKTLDSFGIRSHVAEVNQGPTVTQYAIEIAMGTKLSRIVALASDLALALAATTGQVRIEAPIPGRSLVGIEIPNKRPEVVTLKKLLTSPVFKDNNDPLLVPMGLDVSGQPTATTIAKMPHALIAGTTGSGKSVMLNAWISTLLFRTKPEELRLIMVDPKRVELTGYNGIPHLLTEVIVDPDKILSALNWTVGEMKERYQAFQKVHARNLEGYNALSDVVKKPYIIFIIDELADLMMFAPREAEENITRIAQMARATGIHLIIATQRPSVDVITGLMKANIPTRVAFNVSSLVDSRVIIDTPGAEKLLGKGDMLFLPPDQAKPRRIQGPYVTDKEVHDLVNFLKSQAPPVHYTEEITNQPAQAGVGKKSGAAIGAAADGKDLLFNQALEIIAATNNASASFLQRKLSIGYARAARLLDELEEEGYVGPPNKSKAREILRKPMTDDTVIEQ